MLCVATAFVVALAAAGCGDDGEQPLTSAATTTSTAEDDALDVADLLGATVGPAPDDNGALVLTVNPESSSRLRPGDVITAVDGEPVSNADELTAAVGTPELGQGYTFDVARGSHHFKLGEVLSPTVYIGVEVKEAGGGESGVVVKSIAPDGPAASSKLEPGDVITAIDGTTVSTVPELLDAIGQHQPGDTVELTVTRDGGQQDISVTVADRPEG
jgi:S1-C subfamily serine protease